MHVILEQCEGKTPYYKVGLSNEQQYLDSFTNQGIAPLGYEDLPDKRLDCAYVIQDLSANDESFLYEVYCRFHSIPMEILETKRCVVREFGMDDIDALFELYDSPHFCDFMEPLFEYEAEWEYEQNYIKHIYGLYGFGMWLVFDKATNKLIGRCGLESRKQEDGHDAIELGYGIHYDFQNKGYASEVCTAILDCAKRRELLPVLCRIQPQNIASVALAKRLGFVADEKIVNGEQYWWYKS